MSNADEDESDFVKEIKESLLEAIAIEKSKSKSSLTLNKKIIEMSTDRNNQDDREAKS